MDKLGCPSCAYCIGHGGTLRPICAQHDRVCLPRAVRLCPERPRAWHASSRWYGVCQTCAFTSYRAPAASGYGLHAAYGGKITGAEELGSGNWISPWSEDMTTVNVLVLKQHDHLNAAFQATLASFWETVCCHQG